MKTETFNRLHTLRMENDAVRYAQKEMKPRFDRLAARKENGSAPVAVSAWQLFQTPKPLAAKLVALLGLKNGARVLEPSAGLGRILDALKTFKPCEVVAVEKAQQCAGQLFNQAREGVTLKQRDFMACLPSDLGLFDAVAMNPPFHMREDIKHILHALKFLKPGGKLAALCMDTPHREKALRSMSCHWEKIESGAFKSEGTNTATVLLMIENP